MRANVWVLCFSKKQFIKCGFWPIKPPYLNPYGYYLWGTQKDAPYMKKFTLFARGKIAYNTRRRNANIWRKISVMCWQIFSEDMKSCLKLKVGTSRVLQEIISAELQRGKNPKFPTDARLLSNKFPLITAMHRNTVSNTLNVVHLHNECYSSLPLLNTFHKHFHIKSLQVTKIIIMHFSRLPVQNSSVIPDAILSFFYNHSCF